MFKGNLRFLFLIQYIAFSLLNMTFNYDLTVKMVLCVLTWYLKRYMINNVNFIKENIYAD